MDENSSDKDLVVASLNGDSSAFRFLIERYQGRVYILVGFLIAGSGDLETLRDILQDIFVEFFRFCQAPHDWTKLSVQSELYRIVLHRCAERVRSSSGEIPYKEILIELSQEYQLLNARDESVEKTEAVRQVIEAFQDFEWDVREAVVLREIEGMSLKEIAETTSTTEDVVRSRLFQAEERFANPR